MRALLVLAAACGPAAAVGPTEVKEPPTEHADHPPATPSPTIAWKANGGGFDVQGLPAIAAASEVVVVAITDGDGGRGAPNLRIEVRDRDDKTLQSTIVLTANDGAALLGGGAPPPALAKSIDVANRELARLHGVHDLRQMKAIAVEPGHDNEDQHWATGDNLDVEWRGHHLNVYRHNEKSPLVDRNGTAWLAPPRDAGGLHCENPAYLDQVFHEANQNVVLVVIGYRGNDSCWEPAYQWHVVTWY